jgi:type IX secretion system PorP/SprF family membrane protein
MKTIIVNVAVCFLVQFISGQENHFSQFYTAPQYINPAFTGDAAYMRGGISSRLIETPSDSYTSNTLAHFDMKFRNHHNGIGFLFYSNYEQLRHSKFQVNYSHASKIDQNWWVKAGLGFSVNQRKIINSDLKFPDQYNDFGYTGVNTAEPSIEEKTNFVGIAAGFILYNNAYWLSFSGDYINSPNEYFAGMNYRYPMKFSIMTGLLYPIGKNKSSKRRFSRFGGLKPASSLGPVFCFLKHGTQIEQSAGLAFHLQPFFGGLHYRYHHNFNIDNNDYAYKSIAMVTGYRREEISISYSLDYSINKNITHEVMAHEIAIVIYFSSAKNDYKRIPMIPLPNQMIY